MNATDIKIQLLMNEEVIYETTFQENIINFKYNKTNDEYRLHLPTLILILNSFGFTSRYPEGTFKISIIKLSKKDFLGECVFIYDPNKKEYSKIHNKQTESIQVNDFITYFDYMLYTFDNEAHLQRVHKNWNLERNLIKILENIRTGIGNKKRFKYHFIIIGYHSNSKKFKNMIKHRINHELDMEEKRKQLASKYKNSYREVIKKDFSTYFIPGLIFFIVNKNLEVKICNGITIKTMHNKLQFFGTHTKNLYDPYEAFNKEKNNLNSETVKCLLRTMIQYEYER